MYSRVSIVESRGGGLMQNAEEKRASVVEIGAEPAPKVLRHRLLTSTA